MHFTNHINIVVSLSRSVFTPYYSEIVLYSMAELLKKNEDGISILFYLQKIYPGIYFVLSGFFSVSLTCTLLDISL